MSVWPEAVWIVKKLQKNFDIITEINYYNQNLNDTNKRINGMIDKLNDIETKNTTLLKENIFTFLSLKDGNNQPLNPPSMYGNGTIWLVPKRE